MIAKKHKLPIELFLRKKAARTKKTSYFTIKVFPAAKQFSRFGLISGRIVFKKATARNKFKRIIFRWLREHQTELPLLDYLLVARSPLLQLNPESVLKELKNAITI